LRKLCYIVCILLLAFSFDINGKVNEIQFTDEEEQFIKEHPVIHLGIDPNFMPFEFIDSDNTYKGIAADYINLLSERTGIEMVIAHDLTWSEAYESAVERQLDVLPCVSKTNEREKYFLFSEPYYSFQRVIVVKDSNDDIRTIDDLSQRTVAVQRNSSHHSYLANNKEIRLSLYTKAEDALAAVVNGSETVFVGNLATSAYLIKANGLTHLKYIQIDSDESQRLHFAVRKDWPELVSIINKGLESITEEEKIEINNKWIGLKNEINYEPIIRSLAIIGSIILLILLVSFYWIIKLKQEVAKRIEIEEDLKRAKIDAEIANQVKSSFLARMSHEIRTPLNAITGMTYLTEKTEVTETQKLYLDKIKQATQTMLGIINDILDFSKIEAGKLEIENISFNLDKVIQQVISIVSFRVEEQKIGFELKKDSRLPTYYYGDPKRIEQVLINLLTNAAKFTNEGEVTLDVRLEEKKDDIYIIKFTIKDTGIGMSQEQVAKLFEPFAQGDSSINRRFGGTGLGLSIVKNLVDLLGGEIHVESVLDKGTKFTVLLGLEIDRIKEIEEKQKISTVYFQKIKVLVIEKNRTSLQLINEYLDSFGMKAAFASSEEAAIHLLETSNLSNEKSYDLLIVDYDTPKEGGIKFVQKIMSDPLVLIKPKVIMIMPIFKEALLDEIERSDIEFSLIKPIIPSILYNGILELFKVEGLESKTPKFITKTIDQTSQVNGYHVLVVEDNKTNQFIAKSILEQSGFQVVLANNGQEGLNYYRERKNEIDLILMDLHMPVLNGYEASIYIREFDPDVPIVAMTADAISGVEEDCKNVGIDQYISKPFDPEKLVETLLDILKNMKVKNLKLEEYKDVGSDMLILDQSDGLRRLGGNEALYHSILDEYLQENKETTILLFQLIQDHKYEEAIQIVHKNKGGSGNIGAKKLHHIASELQKALKTHNEIEIEQLKVSFADCLKQLLDVIENLLKT